MEEKVAVVGEGCVGCKICVESVCPILAIEFVDTRAVVNSEFCVGCGLCVDECPMRCIKLVDR